MPLPASVNQQFRAAARATAPRAGPLWAGPAAAGPLGGVTQSLLGRYLVCKERFRLGVIEGLAPADDWNHRLQYGSMWHVCEAALARGNDPTRGNRAGRAVGLWKQDLARYLDRLCLRYPLRREQVCHWGAVCATQFPHYVRTWEHHPDVVNRTPLLQEEVFDVPYRLPSGRTVRLRGRWDSVDLIRDDPQVGTGVWLTDNKTKGNVDEAAIRRQLRWDLQMMFYAAALCAWRELDDYGTPVRTPPAVEHPFLGIRYNVVRRPLSGGRHSISRKKATQNHPEEPLITFYARLGREIADDPGYFFMRWRSLVLPADVQRFRRQCLDPLLENLLDDYEWWARISPAVRGEQFDSDARRKLCPHHFPHHFRYPYGVYNPMDEGYIGDLDDAMDSGNLAGLRRLDGLFEELQDEDATDGKGVTHAGQ